MPYKDPERKREWDRMSNREKDYRRFGNSIGRTQRKVRARIPLKRQRIAELEKELGYVS